MDIGQTLYWIGLAGCAVFAISGALAAAEKQHDIMSFILLGVVTGIGGGTVRDLILDRPVFWLVDPLYLEVCIAAAALTFFAARTITFKHAALVWMDAAGMALFSIMAAQISQQWHQSWVVAMVMAMITASFGGIIRDVLLDQMPVVLEPEIYVSASLLGALAYLLTCHLQQVAAGSANYLALAIGFFIAFSVRGAAIIWDLRLPKFPTATAE